MKACVLIPAYQAETTLGGVLDAVPSCYPVIVVNDGSTDHTEQVAKKHGATVLNHQRNCGKGTALKTGFQWAITEHFEVIITLDADGQHDPNDIDKLRVVFEQFHADLVVGTRLSDPTNIPPLRYWTNRIGSKVISAVTRISITDTQSGFRIYRAAVLEKITLKTTGFATETELLLKFADVGALIKQVVIRTIYHPPDKTLSHFRPMKDTFRICMLVLRHIFRLT